jgi:hypothetical protein
VSTAVDLDSRPRRSLLGSLRLLFSVRTSDDAECGHHFRPRCGNQLRWQRSFRPAHISCARAGTPSETRQPAGKLLVGVEPGGTMSGRCAAPGPRAQTVRVPGRRDVRGRGGPPARIGPGHPISGTAAASQAFELQNPAHRPAERVP